MINNKNIIKTLIMVIIRLVLGFYTILVVYPFLWSIFSSFKTSREFLLTPLALPTSLNFENYINAFKQAKMANYFLNSIVVTSVALVINLFISLTSAYAITRFINFYTRTIKRLYLAAFMTPAIIGVIPLFFLLQRLHLLDSTVGLIVIYVMYSIPFAVFVMMGFMISMSREYEEAAFIDGCSRYGILFKIIIPMSQPALVTTAVFGFISYWNEYVYAFTFISTDSKKTLPVGIVNLMARATYHTDYGAMFAGLVVVMIPSLIFYMLLQKKITSGLTTGGVKM